MQDRDPTPVHITTWQDAERAACEWMKRSGYPDAVLTPAGPDGGVDVRASTALAQVKFEGGPAGLAKVQQFVGAAGKHRATADLLFFSASGFTRAATKFAEDEGVALFIMGPFGAVSSASQHATNLIRRSLPKPPYEPPVPSEEEIAHRDKVNRWLREQKRQQDYQKFLNGNGHDERRYQPQEEEAIVAEIISSAHAAFPPNAASSLIDAHVVDEEDLTQTERGSVGSIRAEAIGYSE